MVTKGRRHGTSASGSNAGHRRLLHGGCSPATASAPQFTSVIVGYVAWGDAAAMANGSRRSKSSRETDLETKLVEVIVRAARGLRKSSCVADKGRDLRSRVLNPYSYYSSSRMNAYTLLGVHPAAPSELVNFAYWAAAADLQKRRSAGEPVDAVLHAMTRSYELISRPDSRAAYDASIGVLVTPFMIRPLSQVKPPLLSRLLRRRETGRGFDFYEIIGLDSAAPDGMLLEAYKIMRDQYLRAPDAQRRLHLLSSLDRAYAVLSRPEERSRYDAHNRDDSLSAPVSGTEKTSSPNRSEAGVDTASARGRRREPDAGVKRENASELDTVATPRTHRILMIRPVQAVSAARRAVGSVWKIAKLAWSWEVRLSVPRFVFRKKSTATKDVNPEQLANTPKQPKISRRPVPYKSADPEEAFLGRLASRVQQDGRPEGPDTGS